MKTKKPKTVPSKYVTIQEAHENFIELSPKPDNGTNDYSREFSIIMQQLASSTRSITFSDILRETRNFSIPFEQAKRLYNRWVAVMRQLCKVEVVDGCYDEPTIIFC
jgi:hypothetical protein